MAVTGAQTYVNYGYEALATYGTVAASIDQTFGYDTDVSFDFDNQSIRLPVLNSQDYAAQVAGGFKGTWSLTATMADAYFLASVIGDSGDGGAAPFTHTYTYDDVCRSISIDYGVDLSTDSLRTFLGCVPTKCTIKANIGEPITYSMDGFYKTETEGAALGAAVAVTEQPFTFANASLEMPNATPISNVQTVEITYNRNPSELSVLNSRFNAGRYYGSRFVDVKVTMPFEAAATLLEKAYGSATGPGTTVAEVASAELTITNGEAAGAQRSLVMLLTNLMPDTHKTGAKPNELITEDITLTARGLTSIIYSNAEAAAP